jgi:hypothetical protein
VIEEPAPPPASVSLISLGVTCCVVSVLVLVDCYYSIFFWLPKAMDVFNSVKVRIDVLTEMMARYGRFLWALVTLCAVLSIIEAVRRPGHRRTATIQVATLASALILAALARHALWSSLTNLMQGIGTEK